MQTIHLPSLGENVKSATLIRWLKQVGQGVAAGEVLAEFEVENAVVQITANAAGALTAITAKPGQTLAVGAPLAQFGPSSGQPAAPAATPAQSKPGTAPVTSSGTSIPILMPQAGNSMEEGTVLSWKVKEGDTIAVGQIICEIETDKASIEMEATDAGVLAKIVAGPGTVVPVKQPIGYLGSAPGGSSSAPAEQAPSAPAAATATNSAELPKGVVPILMPQAGNSMEEGTILKWRVKEGDAIAVGQIICEIETDKANIEMEATDAGRLAKIVATEGSVVPVKQAMAYLAERSADVEAYLKADGAAAPAAKTQSAQISPSPVSGTQAHTLTAEVSVGGRVKASPAARKIASEKGIDLSVVALGSGPGGRILSTDLASVKAGTAASTRTSAPQAAPGVPGAGGTVRRAMSKMRKAIATNLQQSKQTVPHFYVRVTINAEPLFAFYKAQKPATNCTLNDVILLAVGKAVGEFPAFRSRIEGNEIVEFPTANIGVAVGVDDGLVVPVVMGIDRLTLAQLVPETKRIIENARKGKLENVGRGVFTISNMGMFGVEEFAAIINPPESGILAISAVREAVVVKDGAMRAGKVMTMTLSVDHRVVDGALAAQWVAKLKELLETPEKI